MRLDGDTLTAIVVVMAIYLFGRWLAGDKTWPPRLRLIKGGRK